MAALLLMFIALPDLPGTVVEDAVTANDKVKGNTRVRTYEVDGKTYVGVVYKGLRAAEIPVSIPFSDAAARVVDLVTGADVAATIADGRISFTVNSKAMELGSYVITAAE